MKLICPKCKQPVRDDVLRCTNLIDKPGVAAKQRCGQFLTQRIFDRKQSPDTIRANVFDASKELFRTAMRQTTRDSLIGVITLDDYTFYLAPCFGVRGCQWCGKGPFEDNPSCGRHETYRKCICPDLKDSAPERDLDAVQSTYRGNACFVSLDVGSYGKRSFGPKSHTAFTEWINAKAGKHLDPSLSTQDDAATMGFSIQHDATGSYIRFASGRNEKFTPRVRVYTELITQDYEHRSAAGVKLLSGRASAAYLDSPNAASIKLKDDPGLKSAGGADLLYNTQRNYTGKRVDDGKGAEVWEMKAERDLPKVWFDWGCAVLARELNLDLGAKGRYASREEGTTKMRYFTLRG